jgi:hypothetical protein
MMFSWWFLWMIFMLVFLVTPMGYGWGYRGWGPPYPSYFQRRRGERAALGGSSFNHLSWGWGGDFVWIMVTVAVFWAMTAYWWRW